MAGLIHRHCGIPSASGNILSLKTYLSPTCLCRQEISDALEEVATASQQCFLLSQQHQAALSNPEPLVDQVRGHHQLLLLHQQIVVFATHQCMSYTSLLEHCSHNSVLAMKHEHMCYTATNPWSHGSFCLLLSAKAAQGLALLIRNEICQR